MALIDQPDKIPPRPDAGPLHKHARACVSCGSIIQQGKTCACQDPNILCCPKCSKPIKRALMNAVVAPGTSSDNLEVKITCPTQGCTGYLYTWVYLADFVSNPAE